MDFNVQPDLYLALSHGQTSLPAAASIPSDEAAIGWYKIQREPEILPHFAQTIGVAGTRPMMLRIRQRTSPSLEQPDESTHVYPEFDDFICLPDDNKTNGASSASD